MMIYYVAADSKHKTTSSINKAQQNINAIRTEYQRICDSHLPLTKAHQLYSK